MLNFVFENHLFVVYILVCCLSISSGVLNDNMITRIQSINTTRDYHQFKPEEARPATRLVALKTIPLGPKTPESHIFH